MARTDPLTAAALTLHGHGHHHRHHHHKPKVTAPVTQEFHWGHFHYHMTADQGFWLVIALIVVVFLLVIAVRRQLAGGS